ncbi:MAG: four helix bundle protein [Phycisphaeraceae bacterium]|nr:four helix bundle protein [Phycisphaeraceae bacterium]
MPDSDLKRRTRAFALRVIRLVQALPKSPVADVVGGQLLRSATSVGANDRAAQRARSRADFIHKLAIVEEEADECGYWLDLLAASNVMKPARLEPLLNGCNELTAIIVASIVTAKPRRSVA